MKKTIYTRDTMMKKVGEKGNNATDENVVDLDALYKYGKFDEYTEKLFTHNEIYFSSPDEFNDPFDSKPCYIYEGNEQQIDNYLFELYRKEYPGQSKEEILAYVKRKITTKGKGRIILKKTLEISRERMIKKLSVCCFSEKRDNILMWAHYAKQHTGFCLEFDTDIDFFRPITRAIKVEYDEILPELNLKQLPNYQNRELVMKFLTKADDWKYEQEWRIVERNKGPRTQNFPEEALSGVILGCRIERTNKKKLIRWCSKRKHRPTLYEAKEKQMEFGLDIVKFDY